jgi:hypothetical protein
LGLGQTLQILRVTILTNIFRHKKQLVTHNINHSGDDSHFFYHTLRDDIIVLSYLLSEQVSLSKKMFGFLFFQGVRPLKTNLVENNP